MTLAEAAAAYRSGQLTEPMMLGNDDASIIQVVHEDWDGQQQTETVYQAHPDDLLVQALDLLGIPHEHV
jgi:hypothetical protein